MHLLALAIALLVALGIIAIGILYLSRPRDMARSFGLPPPEEGANVTWWLRLKGVRDIASGLVVLAFMVWGGARAVGIVLLVEALIPAGDMSLILAAKGSRPTAFGVHGVTAALMILAGIILVSGTH